MIKYRLHCDKDHSFDAWFRDSAAYDTQAGAGLLACPNCGSSSIAKALMAPNVTSSKRKDAERPSQTVPTINEAPAEMLELRQKLAALRSEVERNFDYVGKDFAEEARKIHYGETDPHGIYGETSSTEAEALREEGIGFSAIPWLPKSDA
tara:strand:- start:1602 stop:2051 length:450 start_codon:yes stop_codon:yes gene_type:complete